MTQEKKGKRGGVGFCLFPIDVSVFIPFLSIGCFTWCFFGSLPSPRWNGTSHPFRSHSLTDRLIDSLTDSHTHSFLTDLLTHYRPWSTGRSKNKLLTHWLTRSPTDSLTYSLTFTHSLIHSQSVNKTDILLTVIHTSLLTHSVGQSVSQ